ncbi:MAG: alpha/beta hydrolase [Pirellulales bacterium]|nr:alpha/beta hydrolase [Pirellulales bacterium]
MLIQEQAFDGHHDRLNLASGPKHGPPLLLLHGIGRRWQDFVPLLAGLLPRWQIHALDFRGHGHSTRATSYLVVDYVDDALAALRQGGYPAVVYGHSLGALVAMAVAARRPEQVAALVLEDPPLAALGDDLANWPFVPQFAAIQRLLLKRPPAQQLAQRLADLRFAAPNGQGEIRLGDVRDALTLRFMARCLAQVDPAVYTPLVEATWQRGYDRSAVIAAVKCPVLLLRGKPELGGMLSHAEADELATSLHDCTVVDFPGSGHLIHWTETESVQRTVHALIEAVRA